MQIFPTNPVDLKLPHNWEEWFNKEAFSSDLNHITSEEFIVLTNGIADYHFLLERAIATKNADDLIMWAFKAYSLVLGMATKHHLAYHRAQELPVFKLAEQVVSKWLQFKNEHYQDYKKFISQ